MPLYINIMKIEITQLDIAKIGYYVYEINQGTCFRCHIETAGVEEIILRNVLCTLGDYYLFPQNVKVNKDEQWVEFHTDLPFSIYLNYAEQVKYNTHFKK